MNLNSSSKSTIELVSMYSSSQLKAIYELIEYINDLSYKYQLYQSHGQGISDPLEFDVIHNE